MSSDLCAVSKATDSNCTVGIRGQSWGLGIKKLRIGSIKHIPSRLHI